MSTTPLQSAVGLANRNGVRFPNELEVGQRIALVMVARSPIERLLTGTQSSSTASTKYGKNQAPHA